MLLHCFSYDNVRYRILDVNNLWHFILDICELMHFGDLIHTEKLLQTVDWLCNISLYRLLLTVLVNVSNLLELGWVSYLYVSALNDLIDRLHYVYLLFIVWEYQLNLVSWINEEILLGPSLFNFLTLLRFFVYDLLLIDNTFLHNHTTVVVPYLLEDIRRKTCKWSDTSWLPLMDAILDLNLGKDVLDDEY